MVELSVIIVNFNQAELLVNCLYSLRIALKNIVSEIIVVDNHSDDDSVSRVRKFFPDVKIIENEKNLGFARANNQGVKISSGEFLLFLNNDTIVLENSIEELLKFIKNHPDAGLVGACLLNKDKTLQRQGGAILPFWRSKKAVEVNFLPATAVLMRKKIFEKIGGFDENFFFYNEDLDLCRRLKKAGYKIYFVPSAKIIHFGGKSTSSISKVAIIEGYLGGLRYCRKHYSALIFSLYRAIVFLTLKFQNLIYYLSPSRFKNREKKSAIEEILKRYKNDERIYKI